MNNTSTTPSPLLGTITFIVLAGIVPLLIILSTPDNGYAAWVGALAMTIASAARFSWTISSRQRHLVEMIVCVFVYGFLGLAPLVQLRMRAEVGTTPGFVEDFATTTVLIILAGFASICFGSLLATIKAPDAAIRVRPVQHLHAPRVVLITLFAFAVAAFYVSRVGLASFGRPRLEFSARLGEVFPDDTTAALIVGFASMSMLVALVAQIMLFRQRRRAGSKAPLLLLAVTAVTLLLIVNPISSARYAVGTVYLAFLAAAGIWGTLRRYRTISVLTLGALFFLFPIASTFRNSLDAKVSLQNPLESLLSGDFDSFDQINNAVYFVAVRGITWGDQLLGVIFFWVPRSIWPDKAIDTGVLLAQFRGYSFQNLSAPLWAEFFINGGWPLLILGMILVGFGARRWDARLDAQILATGTPTLLGSIVPFYFLIMLRGSLLQAMASLGVILLLNWFLTFKSSAPATGKSPSGVSQRSLSRG
ncbi:oligosaccharide repeat unit polymerase [Curtobacterium citreum]|uniref:Oligosaccharide repeat unit polymerase n=1 Tax=Curtobacterium citreum TaxID=2036 RepID=A0ABT2HDT5_9MICO|nr:oligosaccharide repeat unit polymerase [Curtobacterium citreum]MCS6521332.1 oligosaccharide repeat unit polymerase [Curtobacterium citreum]